MTSQPGLTPSSALRGAVDLGALATAREAAQKAEQRRNDPTASALIVDVTEASFQVDVIDQSQTVPVVVDLWAEWCGPCKQLSPILERLAQEYAGRWVLAKVDVDAEQGIAAAFRVQSIPTVMAVLQGKVIPLFQGAVPEAQVRQYLEEVLRVAEESGMTGAVDTGAGAVDTGAGQVGAQPAEDPRWDQAETAIDLGRWDDAVALYAELAAVDNQRAHDAARQVELLRRVDGLDLAAAIAASDAVPDDLDKASAAADGLLAQGQAEEAFDRLLVVVRATSGAERDAARQRLVDMFGLVGDADPTVQAARLRLANALF